VDSEMGQDQTHRSDAPCNSVSLQPRSRWAPRRTPKTFSIELAPDRFKDFWR
jgi:hypothetical protein